MIGRIICEHGTYREMIILEDGEIRLILCMDGEDFKLYRLEVPGDVAHNSAYYTSVDAVEAWQQAM